jgi:hypothetical protein
VHRGLIPLLTVCLLSACAPTRSPSADLGGPLPPAAASDELLPAHLTIHPLTRLGLDPEGHTALIAHIELRDRYNQVARALGRFRLRALPADVADAGDAPADSTWVIDLTTPDRNALMFDDLITRTYTLTLGDLPPWLIAWGNQVGPRGPNAASPLLVVEFNFADSEGRTRVLSDTARLEW